MANCSGSGKSWIKPGKQTICPACKNTIAKIGGHPDRPIPAH